MTNPIGTVVLDTGALIALERADPWMTDLLTRVRQGQMKLVIPDAVIAQVWRTGSGRQARLASVLGSRSAAVVAAPLDREAAKKIGRVIGTSGHTDVIDVHVVVLAVEHRAFVVTSDRDDLMKVAPELASRLVDI